jgi:hypothetical protein
MQNRLHGQVLSCYIGPSFNQELDGFCRSTWRSHEERGSARLVWKINRSTLKRKTKQLFIKKSLFDWFIQCKQKHQNYNQIIKISFDYTFKHFIKNKATWCEQAFITWLTWSRRNSTMSRWLLVAARWRGDIPPLSIKQIRQIAGSSLVSRRTISTGPWEQARWNAVVLSVFFWKKTKC